MITDAIAVKHGQAEFSWGAGASLVAEGRARGAYLAALRALDANENDVKSNIRTRWLLSGISSLFTPPRIQMLRSPSCKRKLSKAMALLPFLAWALISLIPALLYTSSCSTAASVCQPVRIDRVFASDWEFGIAIVQQPTAQPPCVHTEILASQAPFNGNFP
jgi:hypothetical protein